MFIGLQAVTQTMPRQIAAPVFSPFGYGFHLKVLKKRRSLAQSLCFQSSKFGYPDAFPLAVPETNK